MNIKIGMPEILVIFSLMIYPQSFGFSILSFSLAVAARIIDYVMAYSEKIKKAESLNSSVEEASEVLKGLFNVNKD
jgi:hypothetical protein